MDFALDSYREGSLLLIPPLDMFPSKEEKKEEVSQLDAETLGSVSLADIEAQGYGLFWIARVRNAAASEASPSFHTPAGGTSAGATSRIRRYALTMSSYPPSP